MDCGWFLPEIDDNNNNNGSFEKFGNYCTISSLGNITFYDEEGGGGLYKVPTGIIVLLSIFYGSISVTAVVGNSLVIWIILTSKQMHTVTHYFIANLALADIVIALFSIPFQIFLYLLTDLRKI
ncbi:lymnokinin receptor, putative [Pediculus humanus corporis]|uniref:Lymnokinin receptor, putative n=1 Tax=Pediculus humanus subsp. corporis TaxID=121224 RepID=E0V9A0_PEDHC|nr:lymnokinin receptor, putative [Pediculus humanus corporis]EEB09956.1 lymnokinin receptor, putative [Pediculus humanus corporis]